MSASMIRVSLISILAFSSLLACLLRAEKAQAQPQTFFLSDNSELQHLEITLVNPYTGETIDIDEQKNVNTGVYTGTVNPDGQLDVLAMSSLGDALFIRDTLGNQVVNSVEVFFAGQGGDILFLADDTFTLEDTEIFGGSSNDIIWANIGNDRLFGNEGNDIINGGPGNDILGGDEDDDELRGATGSDTYLAGIDADTIIESIADPDVDRIELPGGVTFADLLFIEQGDDLFIEVPTFGSITIVDQLATSSTAVELLDFSSGRSYDLRTGAFVPEPSAALMAAACGLGLLAGRRR